MKPFILLLLSSCLLSLSLSAQKTAVSPTENEIAFRKYLDSTTPDPIEGVYKNMSGSYFRLAIKKTADNKYVAIVLDMDPRLKNRWKVGDEKAQLEKSTIPNLYSVRWFWNDKSAQETVATFENHGILRMDAALESLKYLKLYPTTNSN